MATPFTKQPASNTAPGCGLAKMIICRAPRQALSARDMAAVPLARLCVPMRRQALPSGAATPYTLEALRGV